MTHSCIVCNVRHTSIIFRIVLNLVCFFLPLQVHRLCLELVRNSLFRTYLQTMIVTVGILITNLISQKYMSAFVLTIFMVQRQLRTLLVAHLDYATEVDRLVPLPGFGFRDRDVEVISFVGVVSASRQQSAGDQGGKIVVVIITLTRKEKTS